LLEPQVGELSWDRAPPEVVDDAGDKQPGKANDDSNKMKESSTPVPVDLLTMY